MLRWNEELESLSIEQNAIPFELEYRISPWNRARIFCHWYQI